MQNSSTENLPIGHELTEGTIHPALTVYGSQTCEDTLASIALLDDLDIQYNYYDIDRDPAMLRTSSALENGGKKTPVIDFGDGTVLVAPTSNELTGALERTGRWPKVRQAPA